MCFVQTFLIDSSIFNSGKDSGDRVIELVAHSLLELSVLRATLHMDGFFLHAKFEPQHHARLSKVSKAYRMNRDEILRQIFASQNKSVRERFEPLFDARLSLVQGLKLSHNDMRNFIRGHDYISMVKWVAQREFGMGQLQRVSDDDFALQLFGSLDAAEWRQIGLFRLIRTICGSYSCLLGQNLPRQRRPRGPRSERVAHRGRGGVR
jgi:hypothetical protein